MTNPHGVERRRLHRPELMPDSGDRRGQDGPLLMPLPPGPRQAEPLPGPSDWSFAPPRAASGWTPTRTSWRSSPPSR
jgi:hypothetical protein